MAAPHLTTEQLAERWQRSPMWVARQANAKAIPGAVKVGHLWRFPLEAIERYETRHSVADPMSMTDGSAKRQRSA
jgi:hypothetical protein